MKKNGDKQNRRFLRNSRTASALSSEEEISEVHGAGLRSALKRVKVRASIARVNADKINYNLTTRVVGELLSVPATKLTKKEIEIVKRFDEILHMDLKQARHAKYCPRREDVVVLFQILRKADPKKAQQLSQTFKFRKID